MGKRVTITEHLSLGEVERRYKKAREARESRHWQVIWRLQSGHTSREVAQQLGLSLEWVRVLVRRYNAQGPHGLGDRRRLHAGRAPLLADAELDELKAALLGEVPDELGGGLWNGPKVVAWLQAKVGREVSPRVGSLYLHRAGFTAQSPRPRHVAGDPLAQQEFKKNCSKKSSKK